MRRWIAVGVLAGLLVGGTAVATAMTDTPEPSVGASSITLIYTSRGGSRCTVEVTPVVHTADPVARLIARQFIERIDPQTIELASTGDELRALVDAMSLAAEREVSRRTNSRVEVTLLSDYSCSISITLDGSASATAPIVGDDFGRQPTVVSGRTPDVVGFFRASTGQICEIQLTVDPDIASGATEADGALAARAFLATVDFTTVDYSTAMRELTGFWPPDYDSAEAEVSALARTVTDRMILSLAPPGSAELRITIARWTLCDPAPSA